MSQYDELLSELATRRVDMETTKANKARLLAEFTASTEYQANDIIQKAAAESIEELELRIRQMAVAEYKLNGNKAPHEKVAVKIFTKFQIVDPTRVLAWVKTNLADALVYDEKKVKSYATKIGAVDGTEITEEPQAQIASVL